MLKILQVRLQQYVYWELPDVQAGFRKGRGARDQTANIRWIIGKAKEFQKYIYFCFTDFVEDFDYVYHNKLWNIIKEMGIPLTTLTTLTMLTKKRCTTWELCVKFYLGQNEDCSPGGSISDSSERLLQSGGGGKSIYKVLVKGEFSAMKHSFYKRFLLVMRIWCRHEGIWCFPRPAPPDSLEHRVPHPSRNSLRGCWKLTAIAAWGSVSVEADGRWLCCSVIGNAVGKCQFVVDMAHFGHKSNHALGGIS